MPAGGHAARRHPYQRSIHFWKGIYLMTLHDELTTPWSLHFDRDGTEDIAIICDGDGNDLLSSRPFWLPQIDDPVPPTLAFVRLATAAPRLLTALAAILPYAENEKQSLYECWKRDGDNTTKEELDACERAIEQAQAAITAATAECPRCDTNETVEAL
jgi:hypothetical protein